MDQILDDATWQLATIMLVGLIMASGAWIALARLRRRGRADAAAVADRTLKARERSYRQARNDLRDARDALTKGRNGSKAILIDLICDLGDQWEDRDAPRYISYEQSIHALQQIQPLLEMKRPGGFFGGLGGRQDMPELIVILHTLGGYSQSSQMIANAIAAYEGKKTAYVPYVAMSGGTKIALACDKIVMGASASLGPIDTQYSGVSKDNLMRLRNEQEKLPHIPAGILLAMYEAEKFDAFATEHAEAILNAAHVKTGKPNPAVRLSSGEWSHGRSIFPDVAANELGLAVATGCPTRIMNYVNARVRMIDTRIERDARGSGEPVDNSGTQTPSDLPKLTMVN